MKNKKNYEEISQKLEVISRMLQALEYEATFDSFVKYDIQKTRKEINSLIDVIDDIIILTFPK